MGKEHHEITHHKHYSSNEPTSLMAHIGQHKLWDQSHFALLKTLSSALMVSLLTSVIASPLKVKGVVVPLKKDIWQPWKSSASNSKMHNCAV